jgi:hypothetical protein
MTALETSPPAMIPLVMVNTKAERKVALTHRSKKKKMR